MKQKLLHFFAVFVAMAIAIPIANAAASDYKINAPTKNWTTTFSIPDDNSRQLAISIDGVPYTLSETDKALGYVSTYRITKSGNQLVNLGWTSTGAANAFDDAGNYVTHSAGSQGPTQTVTTNPASKFCVREGPNNHTDENGVFLNGSGIEMNGYTAEKITLYLDATGNIRHGNGYIWFAQTLTSTNITCLVIKNINGIPTVSGKKSFNTGIVSGGGNDNYLHFYDTSNESAMKCILQVRGVGIYDVTLNATAGTVTSVNEIPCTANDEFNSLGAHIFMMRGRKLLCRNTRRVGSDGAARNRYSEFEILDITDSYTNPTKIATIDHLPGKYSNGASVGDGHNTGSFIQTHKHSEDKVEIFAYVQGSGCSSYIITASPISDPVTNLKAEITGANKNEVKVSWNAPSKGNVTKYGIRYSINGGAYSVEEELTDTYKVYENQANATYSYAVRAYYGNTNTWSETVTSNSVTVVNYSNPVTNLQVQTSEASPYSAVVNWNAPTEGSPDKYAVSYSNDGGSTWSTAVETTTLSQTFSNLAPGQYQFKVTPYYINAWGEETTATAMVYGITNPVTNITVAYAGNLGNSIAVSWNAPESQPAPDKYQVCYSSNNGTSWSSVVETNDLTYTFSDLAVGTYIFKVTPIYNGYPGEESSSESISVAEATGIKFTTTKRWEVVGTLGTADAPAGKSIAVSNNMMYVAAPDKYGTMSYVSESLGRNPSSWPNFPTGYNSFDWGYAMDNDEAGNIVIISKNGISKPATQFTIYPAGATSNTRKKEITLEGDYLPGGRADFIGVQGKNLLSSGGGYIWIIPQNQKKLMRISVVNGELYGVASWTFADSFYNSFLNNVTQPVVRPLPDGRIYIHPRGNGYKIITLPEHGQEITASMAETISTTGSSPSSNLSSDVFVLQGHTFHVRNDGAKTQSIGIVIENLTEDGNGDATYLPFDGITAAGATSGVSGIGGYGSLVRAVEVDQNNVDVYCYSPNHGVTVYRVSATETYIRTDKLTSLTYNYIENYDENDNKVQNIELIWEAPKNATPTSYKIYRGSSFYKTVDASTLTFTDKGVNQNYTYKVVPIFTGANEDGSLGLSVTTTEVETILYAPIITEVRNYDGYSIVELFYQMPTYNKVKPASYSVYRNGVLLGSGLTQYNFIDDQLPKVLEDKDYTYTIEAVYGDNHNNETRSSVEKTITVKARDWSLSGYQLQEVYNIAISSAIGNLPNNFTNHEYYRQGHFYNGSWYIAQRADNLAKKDDPNYTASDKGTEIQSGVEGTTGGVVTIKATESIDVFNGFTGKPITSEAFASVGLAIDDAGNIFVRYNNDSNSDMATTAPAIDPITGLPVNWLTYISDGYTRRITRGAIYKHKGDGTYEAEPVVINLNPLWTSNDWINTMACSYKSGTAGDKNGQVTGRSDYYNMYGNVMSAEGGYLLLSPSWTRTIFKVKIANGQYVNHEVHQIDQYQSANGMVNVLTGTENYGFKLDGRNAWMAQIRSNGYFGIHGEEENHEEGHEHETHAIFVTDSRVNNSGGTSIVAFDNVATPDVNDGETFLITPASMYSRNQGDFIVTRGTKESISDLASESKFMPPMPVAQMKQTTINENVATNANGNWFHAEKGTYLNTNGNDAECVYIYQYVPGIRFAKYRLIPDLSLPVATPTLDISTAYNEGGTEITHFNGVSTWLRPEVFGTSNPDNASVWIKSYTFDLLDAKGSVVYTAEVPEAKDAEGNPVVEYAFDYIVDNNIENVDNCDLNSQAYTARIAVNYEFINGDIQQSAYNYAIDQNDYVAKPAEDLQVWVFKNNNKTVTEWVQDENGVWLTEDRVVDSYRVELDFNIPDYKQEDKKEPVSNYTIYAVPTINGVEVNEMIPLNDFDLHNGLEVVNGIERAKSTIASKVPGTYDFENSKAPFYHKEGDAWGIAGQSRAKTVLTWHHSVTDGTYNEATTSRSTKWDEPHKWQYYVVANYADNNTYIRKTAPAVISTTADEGMIETGVDVIGYNASLLNVYPIPASTEIIIQSPEAINNIVIYNNAGAEVMNINGDGETIIAVNIESLATGYYFVKVNNQVAKKIIKK